MGKAKKLKLTKAARHEALDQQIAREELAHSKNRTKVRNRNDADDQYVDDKLSARILRQAHVQQRDLDRECGELGSHNKPKTTTLGEVQKGIEGDSTDSEAHSDIEEETSFYENIQIDEEDEKALQLFMNPNPTPRRTLADIIAEKLTEKQTEIHTQFSDAASVQFQDVDPRVKSMYQNVGTVLGQYRSGKLPKALKIVPNLQNWEQILYLTNPEKWSAAAMYAATRIFTSNLTEKMAQRFFNLVLLPRVRDDIAEYKKLNFHLYQALRKALFKPGAFFKGFLLPLCESGTCTLREAIIIGSVIARCSIPVLHSAAAMLKIAEMNYNGANSIFLRIFFDKRYALPYRVVDAAVHHFIRFQLDNRQMPVLWHQALLTFAQRYKADISSEQKEAILQLLTVHKHPSITPEIRRELLHSKCREDEVSLDTEMNGD